MKLVTLELETTDPAGTRAFYTQHLGLSIVAESVDSLTLQVGWTQLTFRSTTKPVAPYHFAINVPSGMLEMCMHWFALDYIDTQARGQTIAEFGDWRARSAYFFDNNGNLLEFITRHDLACHEGNLTDCDFFQGISEIGIVTPCVIKTCRQLWERFGVKRFSKSKPMPDFAAFGDDNGLFIISKANRNWLFTTVPAALTNYRMTFELNGTLQSLASDELSTSSDAVCFCPLAHKHSRSADKQRIDSISLSVSM
ncbi:VOC family protein [Spirosoma sp. KNUC1025]|uniref:VOC family protein n=1 Tax=Spirosoma sp. KNUC1025 TaxID=2894082 RepID=UPI003864F7B9|nr:VOC family protein [Spirosoma sp. KNUC1025]